MPVQGARLRKRVVADVALKVASVLVLPEVDHQTRAFREKAPTVRKFTLEDSDKAAVIFLKGSNPLVGARRQRRQPCVVLEYGGLGLINANDVVVFLCLRISRSDSGQHSRLLLSIA